MNADGTPDYHGWPDSFGFLPSTQRVYNPQGGPADDLCSPPAMPTFDAAACQAAVAAKDTPVQPVLAFPPQQPKAAMDLEPADSSMTGIDFAPGSFVGGVVHRGAALVSRQGDFGFSAGNGEPEEGHDVQLVNFSAPGEPLRTTLQRFAFNCRVADQTHPNGAAGCTHPADQAFTDILDAFNRPTFATFGPDGALYVVDYRAVRDVGQSDPDARITNPADGPLVQFPFTGRSGRSPEADGAHGGGRSGLPRSGSRRSGGGRPGTEGTCSPIARARPSRSSRRQRPPDGRATWYGMPDRADARSSSGAEPRASSSIAARGRDRPVEPYREARPAVPIGGRGSRDRRPDAIGPGPRARAEGTPGLVEARARIAARPSPWPCLAAGSDLQSAGGAGPGAALDPRAAPGLGPPTVGQAPSGSLLGPLDRDRRRHPNAGRDARRQPSGHRLRGRRAGHRAPLPPDRGSGHGRRPGRARGAGLAGSPCAGVLVSAATPPSAGRPTGSRGASRLRPSPGPRLSPSPARGRHRGR